MISRQASMQSESISELSFNSPSAARAYKMVAYSLLSIPCSLALGLGQLVALQPPSIITMQLGSQITRLTPSRQFWNTYTMEIVSYFVLWAWNHIKSSLEVIQVEMSFRKGICLSHICLTHFQFSEPALSILAFGKFKVISDVAINCHSEQDIHSDKCLCEINFEC